MEIANRVDAKVEPVIAPVGVPSLVKNSTLPTPEETIQNRDKTQFRQGVEQTTSEVEEKPEKVEEEKVFERMDEPEIKGTIVITVYKNHPYEVELSGMITGAERDLAIRALMKGYAVWKHKQAMINEAKIKAEDDRKKKEEEDARS